LCPYQKTAEFEVANICYCYFCTGIRARHAHEKAVTVGGSNNAGVWDRASSHREFRGEASNVKAILVFPYKKQKKNAFLAYFNINFCL